MFLATELGFSWPDMSSLAIAGAGLALFIAIFVLSVQKKVFFSTAIVYLALGVLLLVLLRLFGFDGPSIELGSGGLVDKISALVIAVVLFATGLTLERKISFAGWRSTAVLLLLVMPATIGALLLFGHFFLLLSVPAALFLAAALAPTDPVLAQGLSTRELEKEEEETEFALTSEAGFNDGLAFPFVLLAGYLASNMDIATWALADLVWAVPVAFFIGILLGGGIAETIAYLDRRGLQSSSLDAWIAIAAVVTIYGVCELLGGYGFIAAFVGGIAYRRREKADLDIEHHHRVHSGAETIERLGELMIIVFLGSLLSLEVISTPSLLGWAFVLFLLLLRPLLVLLFSWKSGLLLKEKLWIGWFGVRGISSIYYLAWGAGAAFLAGEEWKEVSSIILVAVAASILLHGASAMIFHRMGWNPPRHED